MTAPRQKKKNDITPCKLLEKPHSELTDGELEEVLRVDIHRGVPEDQLATIASGRHELESRIRGGEILSILTDVASACAPRRIPLNSCADIKNRLNPECCLACGEWKTNRFPIPHILSPADVDNPRDDIKAANAVTVLGHTPDGDILLYVGGKMLRASVSKMTPAWLRVLTGVPGDEKLKRIARRWQLEANEKGTFDPEKRIGAGVWRIKDAWVIVSGTSALVIAGTTANIVEEPVFEGHCIEFDAADSWVDLETVKASFEAGDLKTSFEECLGIVRQWRWTKTDMAEYAAALICLSPVQRLLRWRPNVAISGPSGCGKSLFAEDLVGRLWGPLVVRSDRATAHSIAQSVGSTARILILDEFEKSRRIGEILDLLKLAGRGGFKTSGTGEKSALKFEIRHLTWTLAAHLPSALKTDAAKANRTIKLGMNGGREGSPPTLPSDEAFRDLAARIVGAVLKNWQAIQTAEDAIDSRQVQLFAALPGANSRTVDVFRSASALLTVATGADWTIPNWGAEPLPSDGDMLLDAILGAMVPGRMGTTVEQLLSDDAGTKDLAAVGLKIVYHKSVKCLAVQPSQVRTQLLGKTEFAEMDPGEALERIPGAVKGISKFGGLTTQRVVFVPFSVIEEANCKPCKPTVNHPVNRETGSSKDKDINSLQVYNNSLPEKDEETQPTEEPKKPLPKNGQGLTSTCKPNPSNQHENRGQTVYKTVDTEFTVYNQDAPDGKNGKVVV